MEFDQLRHFLKVAQLGNFTRAAEAVALSQPALSRSIARLEQELGQPVFERQARQRKVTLTDAGRILLPRARPWPAHAARWSGSSHRPYCPQ